MTTLEEEFSFEQTDIDHHMGTLDKIKTFLFRTYENKYGTTPKKFSLKYSEGKIEIYSKKN
jgi:hypothetical protein